MAAAGILLSGVASTVSAASTTAAPSNVEERLYQLVHLLDEKKQAGAWDEIPDILRRMSSIDPDHPKPYIQAVLFESERGALKEAPALLDKLGAKNGPGRAYAEAMLSYMTGKPDDARQGFAAALETYTARRHVAGQAACHTALGNVARAKDPEAAAKEFAEASELLDRAGDRHGLAEILNNRADLELKIHGPAAALAVYHVSLPIQEEIGDQRGAARAHHGIGKCLLATRDRAGALKSFRRALGIRQEVRDLNGVISTLDQIAVVQESGFDWEAALETRRRAVQLAETVPDERQQASTYRLLADTLVSAGRLREALPAFETCARLYGEVGNRGSERARALAALGTTLRGLGEIRRARTALDTALTEARAVKDRPAEGTVLTNLGNLALTNGDLATALVLENEALAIFREVKDRPDELSCLNNIGAIYLTLGSLSRAHRYVEDGLRMAEELKDRPLEAQARHNLGILLAEQGDLDRALEELKRSVGIRKIRHELRRAAFGQATVAETLLRMGRREEARKQLDEALAGLRRTGDAGGEAYALNVLGEMRLLERDPGASLKAHRRALALAKTADLPDERWRAHAGIAAALSSKGRTREALEETMNALSEVERVRTGLVTGELKMRFLAGKIGLYEQALGSILPRAGKPVGPQALSTSFLLAERARARSLLDHLAAASAPAALKAASPELQRRQTEALDELGEELARFARARGQARAAARRKVDAARDRLDRVQIEIQNALGRTVSPLEAAPVSLEEVQRSILRTGDVLLEYFIGADRAWLWRIERDRAALVPLGPPRELAGLVTSFLDAVEASRRDPTNARPDLAASEKLAAAILPPDPLPSGARVIVVPDGPLHHVPFDALRVGGRFVLETNEVAIAPSATAFGILRRRAPPSSRSGFLGVADPVTTVAGDTLAPLPFARQEVDSVAGLFPESDRKVLTGADAARATIRSLDLRRYRFVHFATHGWLDPGEWQDSGLWLSPASPGGPAEILSVEDTLSLTLDAELVVLSACRSGAGEMLSGEGLVGLTRAFLHSGSRGVVVSLWDVPDQSTADLMRAFYGAMRRGESASTALREAKLELLRSTVPGRNRIARWAGFVLVGVHGPPSTPDGGR